MAMTARMMALVAADVRAWLDMGIKFQHVGLNVSSADMHGGMLDRLLAEAFKRENVPLKHVILEVTESVYMGEGDRLVQRAVEALRAKGLRVALDDYGRSEERRVGKDGVSPGRSRWSPFNYQKNTTK